MRGPHAQVDIQLTAPAPLAGLEFPKRARDVDNLIVSYFVTEEIRLDRLGLKCPQRASQFRLHGPQDGRGFRILGFEGRRKKREQNSRSNPYSQV
jgi:hypothetical protein